MTVQVAFETADVATPAAAFDTGPIPVHMLMHGSEGVTPALQFDISQGVGLVVHDCTAQAVGDLNQLTVWVEPTMVCTSMGCQNLLSLNIPAACILHRMLLDATVFCFNSWNRCSITPLHVFHAAFAP